MSRCLIGLGSNLGDRRAILDSAFRALRNSPPIRVVSVSSVHETAPVGGPTGQPSFLNAAAVLDSSLPPQALLELLQKIESQHGRERAETWGPRTLDLDLLLYDDFTMSTPVLVLPHPRMAWRRFVLEPAAEVAGEMLHPTIGWTISRLLDHLNTALPYVAVTGAIAAGKTHLARLLCDKLSARPIFESLDERRLEAFYADPAGHAWALELEFLRQRTGLLSRDSPFWSDRGLAISDFWFDQSAAFARAWLSESQWPSFRELWRQSRQKVVQAKLLVVIDEPAEVLMDRIEHRARPGENRLIATQLERIRRSILDQASQPGLGPVLRLTADPEWSLRESLAAIQAMA